LGERATRAVRKARAGRYSISLAPTGRARCRVGTGLVGRGQVPGGDARNGTAWAWDVLRKDAECMKARFAAAVLAAFVRARCRGG